MNSPPSIRWLVALRAEAKEIIKKHAKTALDISNNGAPINCSTLKVPLNIKQHKARTPVRYTILFII